jgi:hypothetical protein
VAGQLHQPPDPLLLLLELIPPEPLVAAVVVPPDPPDPEVATLDATLASAELTTTVVSPLPVVTVTPSVVGPTVVPFGPVVTVVFTPPIPVVVVPLVTWPVGDPAPLPAFPLVVVEGSSSSPTSSPTVLPQANVSTAAAIAIVAPRET